jgi:hypothetical protein
MAYDRWRINDILREFDRIGLQAYEDSENGGDGLRLVQWAKTSRIWARHRCPGAGGDGAAAGPSEQSGDELEHGECHRDDGPRRQSQARQGQGDETDDAREASGDGRSTPEKCQSPPIRRNGGGKRAELSASVMFSRPGTHGQSRSGQGH